MTARFRKQLLKAIWQGALLLIGLLILFIGIYCAVYQTSWGQSPHWIEAFQDRFKLANLAENVRWPWIHQDTQYWIVRVRFDEGAITLKGEPPHARYWSVTYYAAGEENTSINIDNVYLDENGEYQIVLTKDPQPDIDNQIAVGQAVKRGVIELRITLQENDEPVLLPSVWQNGVMLVEGRTQ
jgi:hypothetical protein